MRRCADAPCFESQSPTSVRAAVARLSPAPQRSKLEAHPMFDPVSEEELANDPAAQLLDQASEEAQKVARNSGATFRAVFQRRETPRDS